MNTEQKQIDTHTYPENASPLELARYQVAVMEAHARGEPIEYSYNSGDSWCLLHWTGWEFLWIKESALIYRYRVARPKIAEGHNPDGLTEAQVGVKDGWRLLSKEEWDAGNRGHRAFDDVCIHYGECRWSELSTRYNHYEEWCFRTKAKPGHYLPKPAPVKTLRPWTFETAPKGYTLLRRKDTPDDMRVIGMWKSDRVCTEGRTYYFIDLLTDCEHSTDNGATWSPCGTYAEGQP